MSTPLALPSLLDACPVCPPGFPDAAAPLQIEEHGGACVAAYQCGLCGTAWETAWDRYGWPMDRLLAPVSPAVAEINLGVLSEALAEQDRERRAAA